MPSGGGLGAIGTPQVGTFTERPAESSTDVPYPATVNDRDLLVLVGSVFNLNLTAIPSGWTAPVPATTPPAVTNFSATGSTQTPNITAAYRAANGTEGGGVLTVPHNNNVSAWQILAFPGVDLSNPMDAAPTTWDSTGDPVLPAITVVTDQAAMVYVVTSVSTTSTTTEPAGYTETGDRSSSTRALGVGYKLGQGVGSTGTLTVDLSGAGRSLGVWLALRPALVRPRLHVAQAALSRASRW